MVWRCIGDTADQLTDRGCRTSVPDPRFIWAQRREPLLVERLDHLPRVLRSRREHCCGVHGAAPLGRRQLTTVLGGLLGFYFQNRPGLISIASKRRTGNGIAQCWCSRRSAGYWTGGSIACGSSTGAWPPGSGASARDRIDDQRLDTLGGQIYTYNLEMILAIQSGSVGWAFAESQRLSSHDQGSQRAKSWILTRFR